LGCPRQPPSVFLPGPYLSLAISRFFCFRSLSLRDPPFFLWCRSPLNFFFSLFPPSDLTTTMTYGLFPDHRRALIFSTHRGSRVHTSCLKSLNNCILLFFFFFFFFRRFDLPSPRFFLSFSVYSPSFCLFPNMFSFLWILLLLPYAQFITHRPPRITTTLLSGVFSRALKRFLFPLFLVSRHFPALPPS